MALEISVSKSIKFGDESLAPKINAEQLLRLQRAKMTTEGELESLKKLIAECFGENKLKVAEYLENVDIMQLAMIQAYLVGGDEMVQTIRSKMGEFNGEGN